MLLRQMEYFQAVVECGSFYAAAEQCHVSQSAISQQIKKLEDEFGVMLFSRHNRGFSLTPAGEHFYRKTRLLRGELEQLLRETKQMASENADTLRLGCYKGYHGQEFSAAIARFSERYPKIPVQVTVGSHEDLYRAMEEGTVDLALNDQRRAFSGAYYNVTLSQSRTFIEISARNPLSALPQVEPEMLKNIPCILVINPSGRQEERDYYDSVVGLHGDYLFADSLQEARLMILTGQGYLPVDVLGDQEWFDTAVKRLPLTRNGEPVTKTYCAFWKKGNSGFYIEEFAEMLEDAFDNGMEK